MAIVFYRKLVFISSAIVLTGFVFLWIADAIFNNSESDFLIRKAFYPLTFRDVFINCLIMAILSLTILLNNYQVVKNNIILSLLAWFLLPGGWIQLALINMEFDLVDFSEGFDSPAIFNLINTLPYIVTSVLLFIQFRRNLKTT